MKWNFAEVGGDLHDAIRKAHLLYALSVGKGLVVKEYRFSYAGGDFITISDSEKMFHFRNREITQRSLRLYFLFYPAEICFSKMQEINTTAYFITGKY